MLRSNNMARAVGRAFSSTYARLEKAAIAAARRNDAMLLYVPDNLAGVYQDSAGAIVGAVGSPVGLLLDQQYASSRFGVELVPNGTFDSDVSGWISTLAGGSISWISGALGVTAGGTGGRGTIGVPTQVGKRYLLRLTGVGGGYRVGNAADGTPTGQISAETAIPGSWSRQIVFIANAETTYVSALNTSAGTTATVDGVSVREVPGYHATQPTAANKPTLARIPRKRGPELVANGSFDSAPTGWAGYNGTLSVVSGRLRLTEDADGFGVRAKYLLNTVPGKAYQVLADGFSGTGPLLVVAVANGDTTAYGTNLGRADTSASGRLFFTFVATGAVTSLIVSAPAAAGQFGEFDNVSVAEVLGWSNVLSFDGVDDFLDVTFRDYYAAGASTCVASWFGAVLANTGFIIAETSLVSNTPLLSPVGIASGASNAGFFMRDDVGAQPHNFTNYSPGGFADTNVVGVVDSGSNLKGYTRGIKTYDVNYSRGGAITASKITVGATQRTGNSNWVKIPIALICWSANVMSDADRKAIERFGSYLVGEPYV